MLGGMTVRLEIDHIKESIMHHFTSRMVEMKQEMESRIDSAIKSFDWDKAVSRAFDECLVEIINLSIKEALQKSFNDDEVLSQMQSIARKAISRYTKGM